MAPPHGGGAVFRHTAAADPAFGGWEGTGSVWRRLGGRGKRYVVNLSQSPAPLHQNITFAESDDLVRRLSRRRGSTLTARCGSAGEARTRRSTETRPTRRRTRRASCST
mmetsp:Transcript_30601/g.91929  ORF Transcript_30601/g.91929 Transcript_30601/m.91929 type:complete len:109 (-) Transcript_30601:294-620(-)